MIYSIKWILYWAFYVSSLNPTPVQIAGVINITDTHAQIYVYPEGYMTLEIKAFNSISTDPKTDRITKGIFLLKNDSVTATLIVSNNNIEYEVYMKNKHEIIKLERDDKY